MLDKSKPVIYYVTEYPEYEAGVQVRTGQVSTKNKCDYLMNVLIEIGFKVVILSDSKYIGKKNSDRGKFTQLFDEAQLKNFWCFREEAGLFKFIKNRCCKYQMYLYMFLKMKRGDNLLVYHDYAYADAIRIIQKIKRFNLILEIEDIYHKVWNIKSRFVQAEKKILEEPYKSIVVSERMKEILKKPNAIVSYGSYKGFEGTINKKIDKGKILIVCTGSFDVGRGTGLLALDTIEQLPDNYQLLMSGKMLPDSEEQIIHRIQGINQKAGFEKCKFLGMLNEYEYEEMLLRANIGLNTQKDGDYASYIFPSKLIKYLSYNLDVVTTPGISIIASEMKECFYITKGYDPVEIAKCIMSISLGEHEDYRKVLVKMHEKFKKEFKKLIDA